MCLTGWYIAVLTLHFYWEDSIEQHNWKRLSLPLVCQLVKPLSCRKGTEASNHHHKEMFQLSFITNRTPKLGKLSALRTIKEWSPFASRLWARSLNNMSDNRSYQPNWDCRWLLRKLYSLSARFGQACSAHQWISSDSLYSLYSNFIPIFVNSAAGSLPLWSRGLLTVILVLKLFRLFFQTHKQAILGKWICQTKAPDMHAIFVGRMHPLMHCFKVRSQDSKAS